MSQNPPLVASGICPLLKLPEPYWGSFIGTLVRWFVSTGITDLVTKGIDVAVFCLFGSLVWENLGSRLSDSTERDKARKSIRAIARFFLYSLVALMSAYIVDFGRDQAWISGHLPANFLMLFEELMVFGGYVMFVPPLYAIGKVLGDPKKAISDVVLPEVTQLLARSFLFLCYLVLLWSQLAYYVNIISTVFANSLIVGLAGIALTFAKLQGWKKRMVPWLLSLPLIVSLGIVLVVLVIVALSVLHLTI